MLNDSFQLGYDSGIPRSPALVVVNIHAEDFNFHADQFDINPNTKILILFEKDYPAAVFFFVLQFFKTTQFTQIVCIESTAMVFIRVGFDGFFVDYPEYLEPQELFKNILRDMGGRTISYSDSSSVTYRDMSWMKATGQYLNATTKYVRSPCSAIHSWLNKCYPTFLLSEKIIISLDGTFWSELDASTYRTLFDVVPTTNVIAVPMPRSIHALEMFYLPYSLSVWIVLALIVILLEVLNMFDPNLFHNDPILLIVCGFQRYDLRQANAKERLICVPMIMFFFVMINAYETRIISYMIHKPSIGRIETIQEMIDSGMRLAAEKSLKPGIFNDSRFIDILIDISNRSSDVLDRKSAYYGNGNLMKERLRMPMNYDQEKQQPAYYILDEIDGMIIYSYWLPFQDSLLEMFYFTRRILYEAGLLDKWTRDYHDGVLSILLVAHNLQNSIDDILDIADMVPTWMALGAGYCFSLTVFVAELAFKIGIRRIKMVT